MSGPLPRFLLPLTVPASRLYRWGVARRNARFDRSEGVQSIDRPVISIGNITTGGTGKTPMVMWTAQTLLDAGHRPAIAMRGYKSVDGWSDEQMEYADRLPDLPVVADPDRAEALRAFLPQHAEIDCVILDDGFQHRRIKRDLDVALIDATAGTFNMRLLPAGRLREPMENLRRADAVIVTHAPTEQSQISDLRSQIERYHGRPPLAWTRHAWTRLDVHHDDGARRSHEVEWLRGKRVITMLGIGNPESVCRQITHLGASVPLEVPSHDHQVFAGDVFDQIELMMVVSGEVEATQEAHALALAGFDGLVVTAKDWVKLRHIVDWSKWTLPIIVPRLEIEFVHGEDAFTELLRRTMPSETASKAAR